METKFQPTNETPLAALTIGQFKDLLGEMVKPQLVVQNKQEAFPETFGKNECSQLTGYAVNTINKMICEKAIPFYKRNAKVLFRRDGARHRLRLRPNDSNPSRPEGESCSLFGESWGAFLRGRTGPLRWNGNGHRPERI